MLCTFIVQVSWMTQNPQADIITCNMVLKRPLVSDTGAQIYTFIVYVSRQPALS